MHGVQHGTCAIADNQRGSHRRGTQLRLVADIKFEDFMVCMAKFD